MALTLQEGAREESSEEGTGAQIAAWLGTPRPLSHVVGTKAPEDFTNTEGEPLAVLTSTSAIQVYCEALSGDFACYARNRTLALTMAKAMGQVPGWKRSGGRPRHPVYGQQIEWIMASADAEDRKRRYQIVKGAAEVDSDFDDIL